MKYAKVIINISNHGTFWGQKNIEISIPRINAGATQVSLSLREKIKGISFGENFHITRTFGESIRVVADELRIPYISQSTQQPGMVETGFGTTTYTMSSRCVNDFVQKIVKSLYYWDKRCQRSVRVTVKEKEDLPLEIVYNGNKISIVLEQMITFADFIKNN